MYQFHVAEPSRAAVLAMSQAAMAAKLFQAHTRAECPGPFMLLDVYRYVSGITFTNRKVKKPKTTKDDVRDVYIATASHLHDGLCACAMVRNRRLLVYVKDAHRRKGVGKTLVENLLANYPLPDNLTGMTGYAGWEDFYRATQVKLP